jgi:hypothetical protein
MLRKIGFGLLWLGFVSYAFLLAPPDQPNTWELIKNLSLGQWEGINPLVIALFNLMGILPIIYTSLMLIDGRGQKIRAWIFAVASFGVGAFAILPYLVFRHPNSAFTGKKDFLLKIIDSHWTGLILTIGAVLLLSFGLLKGNWMDFIQQWQTDRFIHVMSLDFCLLCLVMPALLGDDLARRGIKNPLIFWAIALVPLLGPLAYLCLRPPLPEISLDLIPEGIIEKRE